VKSRAVNSKLCVHCRLQSDPPKTDRAWCSLREGTGAGWEEKGRGPRPPGIPPLRGGYKKDGPAALDRPIARAAPSSAIFGAQIVGRIIVER